MPIGITAFANEAAADELDGQAKIVGELLGGVHQFSLDLDTAGVKVQHGGQTGHHPEAAAPFAELVASEQVSLRECPQGMVRSLVVARNKGGNAMLARWKRRMRLVASRSKARTSAGRTDRVLITLRSRSGIVALLAFRFQVLSIPGERARSGARFDRFRAKNHPL